MFRSRARSNDRPNVRSKGAANPFPHTTSEWFNNSLTNGIFAAGCNNAAYPQGAATPNVPNAPYCVPLGTFGNAARDIFHGPGTIQ